MDASDLDARALSASLEQVARVNAVLGGTRSLRRHLRPIARGMDRLELLDVGVGNGRVPAGLARDLGRRGVQVRWVGVDLHPDVIREAVRTVGGSGARPAGSEGDGSGPPPAGLLRADAAKLPFADDSFDVSTATLTLHHLANPACRTVLAEMARVSRIAVLVSDLERSRLHHLGARILSATVWRRDPITRHDGPLSVRRSFTRAELETLASECSFRTAVVRRYFPFRLLLEGRP